MPHPQRLHNKPVISEKPISHFEVEGCRLEDGFKASTFNLLTFNSRELSPCHWAAFNSSVDDHVQSSRSLALPYPPLVQRMPRHSGSCQASASCWRRSVSFPARYPSLASQLACSSTLYPLLRQISTPFWKASNSRKAPLGVITRSKSPGLSGGGNWQCK